MRVSVLISNYNYGDYVVEAVKSLLEQTRVPDEIVVVDDGSTDDSRKRLESSFGGDERVRCIFGENAGQIIAFNKAYAASSGDILFFLDADDSYKANHIENVTTIFKERPDIDFVVSGYEYFGEEEGAVLKSKKSRSLGFSTIGTYFGWHWVGGCCSAGALRRWVADALFPFKEEWGMYSKGHGDVPVVMGASILGAKKYYIAEPQVRYRMHQKNHSKGVVDHAFNYQAKMLTLKVNEYYWEKTGLPKRHLINALSEFKTIENPTAEELKKYRRLIMKTPQSLVKRMRQSFSAWKHYAKQK